MKSDDEYRAHLYPVEAAALEDDEPYIFMTFTALESERLTFAHALPGLAGLPSSRPTRSEKGFLLRWASALHHTFAPPPALLARDIAILQPSQILALSLQIERARVAFHRASKLHGRDFDQTTVCAVNNRWNNRWASILLGAIHPAYIGQVSV